MPATIAPAREPRKPAPPDVCRLSLIIRGTAYSVRGIPAAAFGATARGYRIRNRENGRAYDLAETVHGPTCDCPDYTFRREGIDPAGCKHVRALVALGLLR